MKVTNIEQSAELGDPRIRILPPHAAAGGLYFSEPISQRDRRLVQAPRTFTPRSSVTLETSADAAELACEYQEIREVHGSVAIKIGNRVESGLPCS